MAMISGGGGGVVQKKKTSKGSVYRVQYRIHHTRFIKILGLLYNTTRVFAKIFATVCGVYEKQPLVQL